MRFKAFNRNISIPKPMREEIITKEFIIFA
jgi:hypothetical protein